MHRRAEGAIIQYALLAQGAPERVMQHCSTVATGAGGSAPFDAAARKRADTRLAGLMGQGLRVLCLAELSRAQAGRAHWTTQKTPLHKMP